MKTLTYLAAIVVIVATIAVPSPVYAAGADTPEESLITNPGFGALSIGGGWEKQERALRGAEFGRHVVESRETYAKAGLDIFPWLTVHGAVGENEIKPDPGASYNDSESTWLAGVRLNLLERRIDTPWFLTSLFRLQALYEYVEREGEVAGYDAEWNEERASLMARMQFFSKEPKLDHPLTPYSTTFFIGPLFSNIDGEFKHPEVNGIADRDITEDEDTGLLLGFDVNFGRNFSMGLESRVFDRSAFNINATFHF